MFSSKTSISFRLKKKKVMDILDGMGVSKLSAFFFFFKVNYSFKFLLMFVTCGCRKANKDEDMKRCKSL